ncbi:MAG: cell division protein FtsH, partial [Bacteroidales bacterium]|nr:cell division protein FtsH [Bacteroidales bacterium]
LNDLERVSKQAYAIVVYYGMNEKIGNTSYYDSSGQSEYTFQKPYSDDTAQLIDSEVHKLIEKSYTRAKEIIQNNKEKMEILANMLLEKEVIFREDVVAILGERPHEVLDIKAEIIEAEEKKTEETPNENSDTTLE